MGLLCGLIGWVLLGPWAAWLGLMVLALWWFMPVAAPIGLVLRLHRARPLADPGLTELLARLARRAGLERAPELYLVPQPVCNAFAVGDRRRAAVVLSAGLLRQLPADEIAGVLAHEVSHIRHDDMRLMQLADQFGRLSNLAVGLIGILLLLHLPLLLAGAAAPPLALVLLILLLPTVQVLLQLAFSRSREYAADLSAAELLGSPGPLARALARLDHLESRAGWPWPWGRSAPQAEGDAWLRTHPPTRERIARLQAVAPDGRFSRFSWRPAPLWRQSLLGGRLGPW